MRWCLAALLFAVAATAQPATAVAVSAPDAGPAAGGVADGGDVGASGVPDGGAARGPTLPGASTPPAGAGGLGWLPGARDREPAGTAGSAPASATASVPASATASVPASATGSEPAGTRPDGASAADLGTPDGGANGTVRVAHRLNLTPRRPGEVVVRLRAAVPAGVDGASVVLGRRAAVVDAEGFAAAGRRYRWTGEDGNATLTYRLSVNRTDDGGTTAVDAGDWALVRTPRPTVATPAAVDVERTYAVDGTGAVGRSLALLGPHETYERTVDGQHVRLVVPAAAAMRPSPSAVAGALANASGTLRVGDRDDAVLIVAAPTSVDWAYAGQQVGDADAWVRADQPLRRPRNAWLHEYVHTRQAFRTTAGTRWVVEGTASYYAALLSLRQGLVDFAQFRRHLLAGSAGDAGGVVLSQPATWARSRAEYEKGGLVVGELDRRIRAATGGRRRFQAVFRWANRRRGPIDRETFAAMVARAGDDSTRSLLRLYAGRSAAPEPWGVAAHREAYGWEPPRVTTRPEAVRAVGSGTARELARRGEAVVLATDERLLVHVSVRNGGGRSARPVTRMRVDFSTVDRTVVEVPGGERRTAVVSHRFRDAGTYYVTVGGSALRVRVVEPTAPARVADVSVDPERVPTGRPVRVTAWVSNRNRRPARVAVPLSVDGEVVGTRTFTLSPYEIRRVTATVRFADAGPHRVTVGGRAAEVAVTDARAGPVGGPGPPPTAPPVVRRPGLTAPGPSPPSSDNPLATPGGGFLGAALALAVAGLVAFRRW